MSEAIAPQDLAPQDLAPQDAAPDDLVARLLFRDAMMLVIDKPAGLPVHRGPNGGANLEALFGVLRFGLPRDPALAHRLDKDTSGCLVLGRHRKALEKLGLLFKQGRVGKRYVALVEGGPAEEEGLVDLALGRLDPSRGWRMKPDPFGQPAQTRWRVLGRGQGVSLLELSPLTGRTHQLRVHCAARGFPIVGDPVYGTAGAHPLQLHARGVEIPLYRNREAVRVEAPAPLHMRRALESFGLAAAP